MYLVLGSCRTSSVVKGCVLGVGELPNLQCCQGVCPWYWGVAEPPVLSRGVSLVLESCRTSSVVKGCVLGVGELPNLQCCQGVCPWCWGVAEPPVLSRGVSLVLGSVSMSITGCSSGSELEVRTHVNL